MPIFESPIWLTQAPCWVYPEEEEACVSFVVGIEPLKGNKMQVELKSVKCRLLPLLAILLVIPKAREIAASTKVSISGNAVIH